MTGTELTFRLRGYDFDELENAKRVATNTGNNELSLASLRLAWDAVIRVLDDHGLCCAPLDGLVKLEDELHELGDLANAPDDFLENPPPVRF